MASNLEALINPGLFKGSRKNPEKLLVKFDLYMEQMNNFFIATGKDTASDKVKLAVLQAVGGTDMVALVKHVGKVKLTDSRSTSSSGCCRSSQSGGSPSRHL